MRDVKLWKFIIQPTLNNLHPNEYSQEFHYHPSSAKLDRCVGSCNALNDLSNKVRFPDKTEDLDLNVFNRIKGINELKTLTKLISCECKCKKEIVIHINGEIMINVDVSVKNVVYVKKITFVILLHQIVKMENI